MRKLYEKNEVLFAVLWIVLYCVIVGTVRGNFGDESGVQMLVLIAFAAGITFFVKQNHLEEKYGLAGWPRSWKRYLFFIPMWILATGNIWDGISPSFKGSALVFAMVSMALVGFVEEMIFRGFLFKAMLIKNRPAVAVGVSALTFGIGHIINLLTGQASVETGVQIVWAIVWGLVFTMVFYRSGSIIPCIIAHSMIDVFSVLSTDNETADWIYVGAVIVVGIIYSIYLIRLKGSNE